MAQVWLGTALGGEETICEIRLDHTFPAFLLTAVQEVLTVFSNAANQGMFCGASNASTSSSFELAEQSSSGDRWLALWRCRGRFIDPGGYRVLVNLLRKQLSGFPEGLFLAITSTSGGRLQEVAWSVLSTIAYPGVSRLPFLLEDNLTDPPDKDVVLRIEFASDVLNDARGQIFSVLDTWESVVTLGGFTDAFSEEATVPEAVAAGDHYQIAPKRVEYALIGLEAPLEAFKVLLNGFIRLHRTLIEIHLVELE